MLAATPELQRTVLTTDDITLIAPRASWDALAAMRAGQFQCNPLCSQGFWAWVPGTKTHCLLKAHLARHGVHHIETVGAAAFEDVLHARRLPQVAPPLLASFDGVAWDKEPKPGRPGDREGDLPLDREAADASVRGALGGRVRWVPAETLRFGSFDIVRAKLPSLESPARDLALGLAVTCKATDGTAPGRSCGYGRLGKRSKSPPGQPLGGSSLPHPRQVTCSLCTTQNWLGLTPLASGRGFCGQTAGEGNCSRAAGRGHAQGAWEMGGAGEAGGLLGASACIRRCEACENCRYVSVSPNHEDCSWFQTCSLSRLKMPPGAESFQTFQVRSIADGSVRAVSPPEGALPCPDHPVTLWLHNPTQSNPRSVLMAEGRQRKWMASSACPEKPPRPSPSFAAHFVGLVSG